MTDLAGQPDVSDEYDPDQEVSLLLAELDRLRATNAALEKEVTTAREAMAIYMRDINIAIEQAERAEARAAALEKALTKYATNEHHRMAEGGGTIVTGYSCDLCGAEATFLKELAHKPTCALTPTPAPQERQNG